MREASRLSQFCIVMFQLLACAPAVADIDAPALTVLGPNPLVIQVGNPANRSMSVTLDGPAQGDTVVTLLSSDPNVATVPSVTVPNGTTIATFQVAAIEQGFAQITASLNGGLASAVIEVLSAADQGGGDLTITALLPYPLTVAKGSSAIMTITLSSAVSSDTPVFLTSDATSLATVPASITIPAGQASASFPVQAISTGTAHVSATFAVGAFAVVGIVEVQPPPPTACDLAASAASHAAQDYATALASIETLCTATQTPKACKQALAAAAASNKLLSSARTAMLTACRPPPKTP